MSCKSIDCPATLPTECQESFLCRSGWVEPALPDDQVGLRAQLRRRDLEASRRAEEFEFSRQNFQFGNGPIGSIR